MAKAFTVTAVWDPDAEVFTTTCDEAGGVTGGVLTIFEFASDLASIQTRLSFFEEKPRGLDSPATKPERRFYSRGR